MKSRDPPVGHAWHMNNNFLLVCHVTHRWSHYVNKRAMLFRDQYAATITSPSIFRKKKMLQTQWHRSTGYENSKMHRGTQHVMLLLRRKFGLRHQLHFFKLLVTELTLDPSPFFCQALGPMGPFNKQSKKHMML